MSKSPYEPKGLGSLKKPSGWKTPNSMTHFKMPAQPRYLAYLAGPISGCSFEGATDWRDKIIQLLPDEIVGLSPMRGKHYLQEVKKIGDSYEDIALSSARGIFTRDFNDCRRSDVLIVYLLGAEKVSIGTVMEIAWAKAFNVPVIAVMENDGNLHDHAMIREAIGFRVTSLEEAAHIATVLLMPAPHTKENSMR